MPYLTSADRIRVDRSVPTTGGELNYAITKLCVEYLGHGYNYAKLNTVIGALECAKLELYRRVAVPYEDIKKEENGDVY